MVFSGIEMYLREIIRTEHKIKVKTMQKTWHTLETG